MKTILALVGTIFTVLVGGFLFWRVVATKPEVAEVKADLRQEIELVDARNQEQWRSLNLDLLRKQKWSLEDRYKGQPFHQWHPSDCAAYRQLVERIKQLEAQQRGKQ